MATEKPTEPVTFAEVRVGDELTFLTANNGFGGTGDYVSRTGQVTKKTDATVTLGIVSGGGWLPDTARIRRADWSHRSPRRVLKADSNPPAKDAEMAATSSDYYGIWCDGAGGFIEAPLYTRVEADEALARHTAEYIAGGEDPDNLKVIELCPDHEEQPKDGCEECDEDLCEHGEPAGECDECADRAP